MRPARSILVCACALALLALSANSPATAQAGPVGTMVNIVNQARAKRGLAPLRRSAPLMRSTRRYSRMLLSRGAFVHSRIARSRRFRAVGEALAKHSGGRARPRRAFALLMGSPPHRRLLLSSWAREIGAGVAVGGSAVWVLQVGRR